MKRILVTGASGFIGSFIVSEGLEKGFEMWAGMRGTSSKGYLTDERIKFAQLNLGNKQELKSQLTSYKEQMNGRWDAKKLSTKLIATKAATTLSLRATTLAWSILAPETVTP